MASVAVHDVIEYFVSDLCIAIRVLRKMLIDGKRFKIYRHIFMKHDNNVQDNNYAIHAQIASKETKKLRKSRSEPIQTYKAR